MAVITLLVMLLTSLEDCNCDCNFESDVLPPLPTKGVRLYAPYNDIMVLPNNSMLPASYFYDADTNNDNITDALWCQSSNDITNNGVWYYPNGSLVTNNEDKNLSTILSPMFCQVGLYRRGGLREAEGIYKCVIADENNISQTLLVGLYRTVTYKENTGPVVSPNEFNKILSCDDNQFTITFTVENGTATYINCSVNDEPIKPTIIHQTILSYELPTNISVLMIFNSSKEGLYNCIVSNSRVEDSNTVIEIPATPAVIYINVSKSIQTSGIISNTTFITSCFSSSDTPHQIYYLIIIPVGIVLIAAIIIILVILCALRLCSKRNKFVINRKGKQENENSTSPGITNISLPVGIYEFTTQSAIVNENEKHDEMQCYDVVLQSTSSFVPIDEIYSTINKKGEENATNTTILDIAEEVEMTSTAKISGTCESTTIADKDINTKKETTNPQLPNESEINNSYIYAVVNKPKK